MKLFNRWTISLTRLLRRRGKQLHITRDQLISSDIRRPSWLASQYIIISMYAMTVSFFISKTDVRKVLRYLAFNIHYNLNP